MSFNLQTQTGLPIAGDDNGNGTQSLWSHISNSVDTGYQLVGPTQVLALSATAQASSAWGTGNGVPAHIRVIGNNPFYLTVGTNPTATSASPYFGNNPAGQVIHVPDGNKISVLQGSGGGNVWLTVISYPDNLT